MASTHGPRAWLAARHSHARAFLDWLPQRLLAHFATHLPGTTRVR